ncbi:hypothetical protein Ancab_039451 [Ancistrocladus abbreviatus]
MAVWNTYPISRFATIARIGGATRWQLDRIDHYRNKRFERALSMYTKNYLPMDLWLGRGRPLNPYLTGIIIDLLRSEMRPRELSIIPDHLFEVGPMKDFLEWSCLRSWVKAMVKLRQMIFDMVALKGLDFRVPILESKVWLLHGSPYLLGEEGKGFLESQSEGTRVKEMSVDLSYDLESDLAKKPFSDNNLRRDIKNSQGDNKPKGEKNRF